MADLNDAYRGFVALGQRVQGYLTGFAGIGAARSEAAGHPDS
ncbi:hypothetical protein [Allokutzneria sp. A3M-2-11 16]|nr:hypothetical protein [Allokutzneria sp. A3M-2-11 16]